MRNNGYKIKVSFSKNTSNVPFNYDKYLRGFVYKAIPEKHGGNFSNYSFSRIRGGNKNGEYIDFEDGVYFIFSSTDKELALKFAREVEKIGELNWGMKVISTDIVVEINRNFYYICSSPILIRENGIIYTFKNDIEKNLDEILTNSMKRKIIGFDNNIIVENLEIKLLNKENPGFSRIRPIKTHGKENKAILGVECPVFIKGSREAVDYCYYNGIGECTGLGFGSIIENFRNFK